MQRDLQDQPAQLDTTERLLAAKLVELAACARRAFPRGQRDITETQVLLALARRSGARGVNETAADLALDPSTVSHAISDLRARQLILDAADPSDGRRRAYSLTPAGEREVGEYLRARTDGVS